MLRRALSAKAAYAKVSGINKGRFAHKAIPSGGAQSTMRRQPKDTIFGLETQ